MLKVLNICKFLPNGRKLLKDISFEVNEGEFVGILGPSGAGKSLTMRCVTGLTNPDRGEVQLHRADGVVYSISKSRGKMLRQIRRQIGMVFQGFHLAKRLTVLENVMIGNLGLINPLRSWIYGFTDEEALAAMAVLDRLNIASLAYRVTGTLSGGEMQRVAIARAILQNPIMLLADEPIASLDPKTGHEIMRLLKDISQEMPLCGVFHQPEMTAQYCTRVIGIKDGAIVYDGAPNLSQYQLEWLYGDELDALDEDEKKEDLLEEDVDVAMPLVEN